MSRPRVLVADDHAPIRAGVSSALEEGGFTVCAQAADAPSAVEAALRERPDVCLLDVRMPGGGIRAAADISAALPETSVVMLSISEDDMDLFAALRAGASGYLLKNTDPGQLQYAIHAVLRGEGAVSGSLVARLIEEVRARSRRQRRVAGRNDVELTEREWEVLEHLREGRTTGEIAYMLAISDVTVRRHLSEVMKKVHVRDRKELLRVLEPRSDG